MIVLLFHTLLEMLRFAVPEVQSPYLAPLFSGDLAVGVFFVLSGDALSAPFFSGGGARVVDRLLVRRYFRLTIPIALCCSLTYLIMVVDLDFHAQAARILQLPDWLGRFLQFTPSIGGLVRYSLMDVYLAHTTGLSYNPFLWTMSMELLGSIYVCGVCYLWPRLRGPQWVGLVIAIGLWLMGSLFSLFLTGMVMGYWRRQGLFDRLLGERKWQILVVLMFVAIAALLVIRAQNHVPTGARSRMFLEALIVFMAYSHVGIKAFLCTRFSRFLGSISFPLYLVHFQVLISLMSWLVIQDYAATGRWDQAHLLGIALLSMVVSVGAACIFREVERTSLRFSDSIILRILS